MKIRESMIKFCEGTDILKLVQLGFICVSSYLMCKAFDGTFGLCYFIMFLSLFGGAMITDNLKSEPKEHYTDEKWR